MQIISTFASVCRLFFIILEVVGSINHAGAIEMVLVKIKRIGFLDWKFAGFMYGNFTDLAVVGVGCANQMGHQIVCRFYVIFSVSLDVALCFLSL